MHNINLNKLTDLQLENIELYDYPDFVDAFLSHAYSTELGRELTDEELEWVTDNCNDFMFKLIIDTLF